MFKIIKLDNFYKFIIVMVIFKVSIMGCFSSDYQNEMFMKFIDGFLKNLTTGNGWNPYEAFAGMPGLFPYPPTMLLVESIGGILNSILGQYGVFWSNFVFKIPTLAFDCLGCYWLTKMFPEKRKYVAILYFASPIIIYASYMHGQLDLIPTVLLVGALYYLRQWGRKKEIYFPIFLALALTSKFHIVAVLPILFFYIEKRDGIRKATQLIGSAIIIAVVIVLPFWGSGFREGVIFNHEQAVLTKVFIDYVNVKLYIPILAVGFVYLKTFSISSINRDLLYSFCGILFAVFLTMIPPMPGWYVWIVPFMAIFFIDIKENKYNMLSIYAVLNMVYLLYFVFAHRTSHTDLYFLNHSMDWLKFNNEVFKNMMFTALTCLLIYSTFLIYQMGISSNSLYKRRNLPFTMGVSGDSGSGKSTLIELITSLVGEKNLLFIEGDGDHKWERGNAMWSHFTHLNPKANHIYRQAADIGMLRTGQKVKRVDYDHITGHFTKEYQIKPRPYILLCGLHSLYLPQIRNELDLKIYMDIDETLRRFWKIQRDISERSYSKEQILGQIEGRMPDAERYIYPQKKYADIVITYFDETLADCLTEDHKVQLSLKVLMSAAINLEPLIQYVENAGVLVKYDYDEDLKKQTVIFYGDVLEYNTLPINDMAWSLIPHLDEIIRENITATDNLHTILGLVILLYISFVLSGGNLQ